MILPRDAHEERLSRGSRSAARGGPPGNRNAEKHGMYRLKAAVRDLGSRAIDRRTQVGRALAAWRRELIADLGGEGTVSTQQAALVDLLTREKLLLDSIDAYLAQLGGQIINRKKRTLIPIVRERSQLADSFTRRMVALGLERKVRDAPDLSSYLAARAGRPSQQAMTTKSAAGGRPLEGTGVDEVPVSGGEDFPGDEEVGRDDDAGESPSPVVSIAGRAQ